MLVESSQHPDMKFEPWGLLAVLATIARREVYKQSVVPAPDSANKDRLDGAPCQVLISLASLDRNHAIGLRLDQRPLWSVGK